jgi:hypothetical protein
MWYFIMVIAGIIFLVYGFISMIRQSIGKNILEIAISLIIGAFEGTGLVAFLFGVLLIFLGTMKLVHGSNWGLN